MPALNHRAQLFLLRAACRQKMPQLAERLRELQTIPAPPRQPPAAKFPRASAVSLGASWRREPFAPLFPCDGGASSPRLGWQRWRMRSEVQTQRLPTEPAAQTLCRRPNLLAAERWLLPSLCPLLDRLAQGLRKSCSFRIEPAARGH